MKISITKISIKKNKKVIQKIQWICFTSPKNIQIIFIHPCVHQTTAKKKKISKLYYYIVVWNWIFDIAQSSHLHLIISHIKTLKSIQGKTYIIPYILHHIHIIYFIEFVGLVFSLLCFLIHSIPRSFSSLLSPFRTRTQHKFSYLNSL